MNNFPIHWGNSINRATAIPTPKITDNARTRPEIHLFPLVSSSNPASSAERIRDLYPTTILSTKATHPRRTGMRKILYFSRTDLVAISSVTISPSGLRTARTERRGDFIIIPSITACPPTAAYRRSDISIPFCLIRRK